MMDMATHYLMSVSSVIIITTIIVMTIVFIFFFAIIFIIIFFIALTMAKMIDSLLTIFFVFLTKPSSKYSPARTETDYESRHPNLNLQSLRQARQKA